MQLQIGLDAISSYKRLAYTPWHALAEFVDNSTQSFFNNEEELRAVSPEGVPPLVVSIAYEREDGGLLRITDTAMGMNEEELDYALHVARPPQNATGRSKYGMGMKTAACWMGNCWTIRTSKLGETTEHQVEINSDNIASGQNELPYRRREGIDPSLHYTIIEIREHHRDFRGRTIGKIKDFLSSMYREDFRNGVMRLEWQGVPLEWQEVEENLLEDREGARFKKDFQFDVDGKPVWGWVGILDRGSRAKAGFSMLYCGRVVKGWPQSWRPTKIYGQLEGSNDLVNQRLVGEIHLDNFTVSHTKDDILWFGHEEDQVEEKLLDACRDYRERAKERRKGTDDGSGPSETEIATAVDELKRELESPEMVDRVRLDVVPAKEAADASFEQIAESVTGTHDATAVAQIGDVSARIYLADDLSPNDPYVAVDSSQADSVTVVVNVCHPHFKGLAGSDGVLNYLRHCAYDAIAEWKAMSRAQRIDPNTIKLLKDQLLRVPFELEQNAGAQDEE